MNTIRNPEREIEVVNGYLASMGQHAIDGAYERDRVLTLIHEQLVEAAQYGHAMYDGFDVADALRDLRQRTVNLATA